MAAATKAWNPTWNPTPNIRISTGVHRGMPHDAVDVAAALLRVGVCVEAAGVFGPGQRAPRPPDVPGRRNHDHRPSGVPDDREHRGLGPDPGAGRTPRGTGRSRHRPPV